MQNSKFKMQKAETKRRDIHRKLVRDRIPERIELAGDTCEIRILGTEEFRKRIREKLVEEARELRKAEKENLVN